MIYMYVYKLGLLNKLWNLLICTAVIGKPSVNLTGSKWNNEFVFSCFWLEKTGLVITILFSLSTLNMGG